LAVSALLALASSSAVGWSVALHLATDDHHGGGSPPHGDAVCLEIALHGHAHNEGSPAHGHPLLISVAAPIPGKLLLLIGAMVGDAPEAVMVATSGRQLLSQGRPTHGPPPRLEAVSVLRI
jgi:hypothetical protein